MIRDVYTRREGIFAEATPPAKGIGFTVLIELAARNVRAAIANGNNFHGYIPVGEH